MVFHFPFLQTRRRSCITYFGNTSYHYGNRHERIGHARGSKWTNILFVPSGRHCFFPFRLKGKQIETLNSLWDLFIKTSIIRYVDNICLWSKRLLFAFRKTFYDISDFFVHFQVSYGEMIGCDNSDVRYILLC